MSSTPEVRSRPPRLSITSTLVLLFTISGFTLLALASASLYHVLRSYQAREHQRYIASKFHFVRSELHGGIQVGEPDAEEEEESDSEQEELEEIMQEIELENATRRLGQYYVEVLDEAMRPLARTPGMIEAIGSTAPFPVPAATIRDARPAAWRARDGRYYLLAGVWIEPDRPTAKPRLIRLALDESAEEHLIAEYRYRAVIVLIAGTLFSSLLGAVLARRAMRPLARIAEAVQRVSVSRFDQHLDASEWPAELRTLAAAFDEMIRRLQDSFARLSQFSADLAHELRTPLNNFMGTTEIALRQDRSVAEYRDVLISNLEESSRMARMIDSLLFLARAEATNRNAELANTFFARREIDEVADYHAAASEEKGVGVRVEGDAEIRGDRDLFRRAISNLLSNSLHYTARGGEVLVSALQTAAGAEIRVADSGAGIESEHLPKVFDRFYRADRARSDYQEGSGLGLSIVKSIMQLHHGEVAIRSTVGVGTTVLLTFPAPQDAATDLVR